MNNDKAQISIELSRLIARQTEFFQKSDPTPSDFKSLNGLVSASANSLLTWSNRTKLHKWIPTAKSSMDEVIATSGPRVAIVLWLHVLTAEWLFVPTVACGVAGNPSASGAVIITRQNRV
jgi:hypothetical protein